MFICFYVVANAYKLSFFFSFVSKKILFCSFSGDAVLQGYISYSVLDFTRNKTILKDFFKKGTDHKFPLFKWFK